MLNQLSARDKAAMVKLLSYEVPVSPRRNKSDPEHPVITNTGKLSMLRVVNSVIHAIDGKPRNVGPVMMRTSPDKTQPTFFTSRFVFDKD